MPSNITGRCLCGGITFEYDGQVGPANYCHCADCRRCTGGPFNIGVRFVRSRFRITKGRPRGFTKAGDSGREFTRHFCPDCGSPLFTSAPKHADLVYVKAGVLDDLSLVQPIRTGSPRPYRGITSLSIFPAFNTVPSSTPPNTPLKLTAAGFSHPGGRGRHEPW
jgi:hypothetical protein